MNSANVNRMLYFSFLPPRKSSLMFLVFRKWSSKALIIFGPLKYQLLLWRLCCCWWWCLNKLTRTKSRPWHARDRSQILPWGWSWIWIWRRRPAHPERGPPDPSVSLSKLADQCLPRLESRGQLANLFNYVMLVGGASGCHCAALGAFQLWPCPPNCISRPISSAPIHPTLFCSPQCLPAPLDAVSIH